MMSLRVGMEWAIGPGGERVEVLREKEVKLWKGKRY
jgi:hypothetical protein